jgi:predicted nucleotidyltransferase
LDPIFWTVPYRIGLKEGTGLGKHWRMTMLDKYRDDIVSLCQRCKVQELYVFGSLLREQDFTQDSDVDLAAVFDQSEVSGSFDRYMDFKMSLEKLLGHPVDLVSLKNTRNRVFLQELNATKELIYAA